MRPPRHRARPRRLAIGAAVVLAASCCVAVVVGVSAGAERSRPRPAPSSSVGRAADDAPSMAAPSVAGSTAAPSVASAMAAPSVAGSTAISEAAASPAATDPGGTDSRATEPGSAGPTTGAPAVPAAGASKRPSAAPTASAYVGTSTVGGLFSGSVAGGHRCSASVVDSPGGDLIVTAAHCVSGSGSGLVFVPAYDRGATPHGVWTVVAAYADPAWISSQDPDHDYAFLRVADSQGSGAPVTLQSVAGGETLGLSPAEGDVVTVAGYAAGANDDPITCTAAVTLTGADPTFRCGGFVDGTSGSPWLSAGAGSSPTTIVGLIGGRDQGGCEAAVSYSAPFDSDTVALWQRAGAGGPSDTLPTPGTSGCGSG